MTRIVTTDYRYEPPPRKRKTTPLTSAELQARKRRHAGRPPFWTAKRIAKLRKLWGTRTYAAIARELGSSKTAVFRQARRLALPPRHLNAWPRSRVATLRALWRKGLSMAAIGQRLGVSRSAVAGKLHRLRLRDERKQPLPERQQVARSP